METKGANESSYQNLDMQKFSERSELFLIPSWPPEANIPKQKSNIFLYDSISQNIKVLAEKLVAFDSSECELQLLYLHAYIKLAPEKISWSI